MSKDKSVTLQQTLQIAIQHHQAGQLRQAEKIYRQILQQHPAQPQALHHLGCIAHLSGNNTKAVELITKALVNQADNPLYYLNLGIAYRALNQAQDAIDAYNKALKLKSNYAEAWNDLGIALSMQKMHEQAIEKFQRAIRLNPSYAEAHNNLGNVFNILKEPEKAQYHCEHALRISPDYAEAHNNLGKALMDLGKLVSAEKHCRQALLLKPDFSAAHYNLSNVLSKLSQYENALSHLQQAVALKPSFSEAHNNLGNILRKRGQLDAALKHYQMALKFQPDLAIAHSNLLFLFSYYVLHSPDEMLAAHQAYDQIHGGDDKAASFVHTPSGDPEKRLRIGYVSADFCRHVVGYFLEPILDQHDRQQVEVFCYAEVKSPDAVTQRLQGKADHWRSTVGITDEAVATMIHDDQIDILIDLAGHTTGNRLKVFCYKPAPIQATYLGYCTTTGLAAMDYWITDAILHPDTTREKASETIVRLPRCWLCYRPVEDAPEVVVPDPNRPLTFGSLNDLSKLTDEVIARWSTILKALPDSQLLLKTRVLSDVGVQNQITAQFAAQGITSERLTLLPATPDYLTSYHEIDIALDPFPRTGGATTADALWMGVPVITLSGERMIERQGASMLSALGLDEFIADSADDYIAKVVALANDAPRRQALRATLRAQMATSPLGDARGMAQALEDVYRSMWRAPIN